MSSIEKTEGRATCCSLHEEPDTNPHASFREAGQDYNVYLGPGVGYADAVNWETNTIAELKPDTVAARRAGMAQLRRYQAKLESDTSEKWRIQLETYRPWNGRH